MNAPESDAANSMLRANTMVATQDSLPAERVTIVCEELKHATHAAHGRINHHPYLCGLIKAGYPLTRYQSLLAMYAALYGALETQIESFLARNHVPFAYAHRRKTGWLRDDMAHFGMNADQPPWQPPEMPARMHLSDCGALIGTLYVIEGATLGGEIISRHLKDNLALGPASGARFFNGYGSAQATRHNWQTFCNFANSNDASKGVLACAKLSAVRTFELFESQLDALQARAVQ